MKNDWQLIETAPEGVAVETKIEDGRGVRNMTTLRKQDRLWWFTDGSMYVYYEPTHWREITR